MPDYGYKVVYADPKLLGEAGYGALSHQPFILDPEPGYARLPNQFPETVNPRVQIALEFQMWAADKGLRPAFVIPTTTTTYIAGSHDRCVATPILAVADIARD